jgi:hypothetical protein
MQALTIHVCFMIAFYLGFTILKKLLRRMSVTRFFIPQKRKLNLRSALTDFYLEISNGLDASTIYAGSFRSFASHLKDMPNADIHITNHFKHCVYDTIKINWGKLLLYVATFKEELSLPTELIIPILEKRKFRRIMSGKHTVRVLFVTDSLIYHVVGQNVETRVNIWFRKQLEVKAARQKRYDLGMREEECRTPQKGLDLGMREDECKTQQPKSRKEEVFKKYHRDNHSLGACANLETIIDMDEKQSENMAHSTLRKSKREGKHRLKRYNSETDVTEKSVSDSEDNCKL